MSALKILRAVGVTNDLQFCKVNEFYVGFGIGLI